MTPEQIDRLRARMPARGADESQLLALVTLDARGEGAFELADDAQTRRLLLSVQIGEIEPA